MREDKEPSWWKKFTDIGAHIKGNEWKLFPFIMFAAAVYVLIYMNT